MAKTYPIQQSFSAGEISPKLLARSDLQGYKHSALELLNMVPSIQGPADSRSGFKWVGQAASPAEQYARMMPFHVSFGEAYVIIVTTAWVYVADRNGQQPANNLILNANFNAGAADWTVDAAGAAEVVFAGGLCALTSVGVIPAAIWQSVTSAEPTENHHVIVNGIAPGPMRILIGTVQGTGDILDEVFTGEDVRLSYVPGVANYFVQFQVEGGESKVLDDVATYPLVNPATEFVRFASPWTTAAQIEDIQFEMGPSGNDMYMFQRDVEPHILSYTGAHDWTFNAIDFTTDVPDTSAEQGPWGDDYPGCVAFFKGRMYVGGTRLQPVAIWASKPGIFFDFTLGAQDDANDAMFLPLDRNGDIQWMRGGKALFAGMDTGEHIIFSSTGEAPDIQNVDTEQQSAYGSARVHAVLIGEKVAYITPDRRKVFLTGYVRDSLGWDSEDVSYPSEHITAGRLREIEITVTPDQTLWFPTLDGKLVGMIYDARRNIIGWHRHETDGFIVSITVLKAFGLQQLWVAVLRNGHLNFERTSITDAQMDSFVDITENFPTTVFFGFDHLVGLTVQVVADGAVHRDVVVAGDGSITLDYAARHIVAGLKFIARVRTVPVDMLTQDESRTSYLKSWNKIFVRMLESSRPLINGVRPPVRNEVTPMGEAEPLRTEDLEVSNLGWDLYASITIEQDLPLKLSVSGVFGELDQENIG